MADGIEAVANTLRDLRQQKDAVTEAGSEVLPYSRRVGDALGALRALVTDQTPTAQLESELRVDHGIVAALIGGEKATQLIGRLPKIRRVVATDVEAAFQRDPSATSYGEVIAAYPSVRAVATYRIAHAFYELGERVVARIMSEEAHGATGIDIHPGATIGSHFFIDHGTGVVIGETCVIGDRVKLYQGVTLGALSMPRDARGDLIREAKRHPTLEDGVTVYAGATILGGDTVIGRGSVIGGSVFLTESVPPGSRVMAEAPRQLMKGEAAEEAMQLHWDI